MDPSKERDIPRNMTQEMFPPFIREMPIRVSPWTLAILTDVSLLSLVIAGKFCDSSLT
jgi:hypothetical protein